MNDIIRACPYLVLGVGFGATATEANRAFARRLQELPNLPFEEPDLTWAQSLFRQPEELRSSVESLRVPTGSAVAPDPREGLFRPGASPVPRSTPKLSEADQSQLRSRLVEDLRAQLLNEIKPSLQHSPYPKST
jgi:hypothetical protein